MPNQREPEPAVRSPLIVLAGPTAVGKSEVALLLAEAIDGEIVSVDSMQVYRGLDIGTAKPSPAERARVRHHLLDVVDITDSFDVSQFVQLTSTAVSEIQARGRTAILCGGTGLYFRAFFEGLGASPGSDPVLRAALESVPLPELLEELAAKDPATFDRIDRKNPRRVIRAVEVIRLSGKPFSGQRSCWCPPGESSRHSIRFGLVRTSEDLRERINQRVEDMFQRGLVEETEQLLKHGLAQNRNALQALGYRQVADFLLGTRSLAEARERVKTRTRHFAKRQMTWFRRQMQLQWVEIAAGESARKTAQRLVAELCVSPSRGTLQNE